MKTPCSGVLDYKIDTFDMQNRKTGQFKDHILEAIQSSAESDDTEDTLEVLLQALRNPKLQDEELISLNITLDRYYSAGNFCFKKGLCMI